MRAARQRGTNSSTTVTPAFATSSCTFLGVGGVDKRSPTRSRRGKTFPPSAGRREPRTSDTAGGPPRRRRARRQGEAAPTSPAQSGPALARPKKPSHARGKFASWSADSVQISFLRMRNFSLISIHLKTASKRAHSVIL